MRPASGGLARLYADEQPRLCRSVRRHLDDPEEAADIVQDAFVRLVQARPMDALRSPQAYLQRIVRNLLRDRAKSGAARLRAKLVDLERLHHPAIAPDQEWQMEATQLLAAYTSVVDAMSPRTREIFLLHRVEELRYRDIADRLDISVSTVEYHMARALMQLDEALDR